MAQSYKASLDVNCWKQHTCVSCGTKFRYALIRKANGEANSEEAAMVAAATNAQKMMDEEVDVHPCPGCGCVQPDMVASARRPWFAGGALIPVIGLIATLILGLSHVVTIQTAALIATACVGLGFLLFFLGSFKDPNGSLAENLSRAQESVNSQVLTIDERGRGAPDESAASQTSGFTGRALAGLGLTAVALLLAAAPLALPVVSGWKLNDHWYPAVVGPGDSSTFYMQTNIRSIKGYWNGGVSTTVKNAGEIGLANPSLQGKTKNSNWGNTISGKSVSSQNHRVWVKIDMPADAALAGKTLKLDVQVNANFPEEMGGGFQNSSRPFREEGSVVLSSPKSGSTYNLSYWLGETMALLALGIGWTMLLSAASTMSSQSHPTKVTPIKEPGADESEEAESPDFGG